MKYIIVFFRFNIFDSAIFNRLGIKFLRETSRSSPDVVKAADKIRKKYIGASSSQPTKQYRYTKDVMKAQASNCGVYEDGWPADLYWLRAFRTCSERGKRYNFASQTVVRVQRCLWWICRSGPQAPLSLTSRC